MSQYKYKDNKGDYIISFAVMIQSLLVLMQLTLIDVFHIEPENTTTYRVVFSAIPMILAMIVSVARNIKMWIVSAVLVIVLLIFTIIFFPENKEYVMSKGVRFTLPICIPSFLCLCTIKRLEITEKLMYFISWACVAVVSFYFFMYFRGFFYIENYDMTFSYACLLPMIILYARKGLISVVVSFFLFICVFAIGSRGAAFYYLVFVIIDMIQKKSKWTWVLFLSGALFIALLPNLSDFLDTIGIHSRTLSLLDSGDITSDSGRGSIASTCWNALLSKSPILGLGVFGDYVIIVDGYCHNIFLEILIDFGLVAGVLLILYLVTRLLRIYSHSDREYRNKIIQYFCAFILPFMTSGSYLINSDFWIFLGLCVLTERINRTRKAQQLGYVDCNQAACR